MTFDPQDSHGCGGDTCHPRNRVRKKTIVKIGFWGPTWGESASEKAGQRG